MANSSIQLESSWQQLLGEQFAQPYMRELGSFLRAEKARGAHIFPPGKQMFAALNLTPVEKVKVVIIGQDPYHGSNQAHGLCFSVLPGTPLPPSLRNIFKEIQSDLGVQQEISRDRGCLTSWAEQGVLLLNAVLSVEQSLAGSHQNKGWEQFTDAVVRELCEAREGLVFLLWGSYAQKKGSMVDTTKHCVLKAPHPSPLSAHRGFFGCKHFSKANAYLSAHNQEPIDWLAID